MITQEDKAAVKKTLALSGIPYRTINVIGVDRFIVNITCYSEKAALEWQHILANAFKPARVLISKTAWLNKVNTGTSMLPTQTIGYMVGTLYEMNNR